MAWTLTRPRDTGEWDVTAPGGTFLTLDPGDRPAYRVDDFWPATPGSTTARSGFVIPNSGAVGMWAPATTDRLRQTITWEVA